MKRPVPKYLVISEDTVIGQYGLDTQRLPIGSRITMHKTKATAVNAAKKRSRYGDRLYVVKVVGFAEQETPPVRYIDL